jgi:hypothetical protein
MFSYAVAGERLAREKLFSVGAHEVDDDIYNHPYIRDHFADGKIERPEVTQARLAAQLAKVEADNKEAAIVTAKANAAFARLKAAQPEAKASAADIERELNTPVSQLKTVQGSDISQPVSTLRVKANR